MAALSVNEVLEQVKALPTMSRLDPARFAEEDGLADSLAQKFGKEDLKPTQLRKVFHELKAIQREIKSKDLQDQFERTRVVKLMPTLAYACGRGLIPKEFYELMKTCLSPQKLVTNEDFLQVVEFVTAILAYHKYHQEVKGERR